MDFYEDIYKEQLNKEKAAANDEKLSQELAADQDEKLAQELATVGRRILVTTRNTLYLQMRFLDVALSSYPFLGDFSIETMGTDGLALYYNPRYLGGLYREDANLLNRLYLHQVLHGLFRHVNRKPNLNQELYDLSCDIVTESIIDSMYHSSVRRSSSLLRRETYRKLKAEMKVLTPAKVYQYLLKTYPFLKPELPNAAAQTGETLQPNISAQPNVASADISSYLHLFEEFRLDSHDYWPEPDDQKKQSQVENKWKDISEKSQTDMETFSKDETPDSGSLIENLKVENRERFDYRTFLRKFAVLREEMQVDPDTFDYVYYSFGLSMYGNMPLIEPQEWKEVQKIEDFVIVVDTSMSTSGPLVRKFLEQTYHILCENDSFFRKINIHIIQCDDAVQEDRLIKSEKELTDYMDNFELHGGGGTDFRPAFEYVEQLYQSHAFSQLKGLLYFTDGKGIYPAKRPNYEVAFLFLQEEYEDTQVPPWAIKLILEEEDL